MRVSVATDMEPGAYEERARQKIGDQLFAASSGNRLIQVGVSAQVRRLAQDVRLADADRISPHRLRHSAALADGAALHEVQDLLDHADRAPPAATT